jgi:tetratricopeptide (TPR) repeat protein
MRRLEIARLSATVLMLVATVPALAQAPTRLSPAEMAVAAARDHDPADLSFSDKAAAMKEGEIAAADTAQGSPEKRALIDQVNAAVAAKNWSAAAEAARKLVALDPHWHNFEMLGDAELNAGHYEPAVAAYDEGVKRAEADKESGSAETRSARGAMLTKEGNAFLKLKRNKEAIAAYTKAAALDPHPATAYFNLCATQYNTGEAAGAIAACNQAIKADPRKADAYFVKGSLLVGDSKTDKDGKVTSPPGTIEALRKYLELAPNGAHAEDVRQMLAYLGVKP